MLEGTWRWRPIPDADQKQAGMWMLAPQKILNAVDGKPARLLWSGNLSHAMGMAYDLGRYRLKFTAPLGTSPQTSGTLEHIPWSITKGGALEFGRIGPRPPGKQAWPYKRATRIRWRPSHYQISDRGLWLLDPGPVDETEIRAEWPEYLIDFLGQLKEKPKQAIENHWLIDNQCAICGKWIDHRQKIHSGCAQRLPTMV